jgi:ADP-ribose pyrophosphatase YjhB (NUDIX family)
MGEPGQLAHSGATGGGTLDRLGERSWEERAIQIGDLRIEQAALVTFCRQAEPPCVRFEFGEDPPVWNRLRSTLLSELQATAAQQGRRFVSGRLLDMTAARPEASERGIPRAASSFEIHLSQTTYFRFAAMSNSLDLDMSRYLPDLPAQTLREAWSAYDPRNLTEVAALPAPACVGTVTVVVATQSRPTIVCMERSRTLFQASGGPGDSPDPASAQQPRTSAVHFVGEGMDLHDREPNGRFSPAQTAMRGLKEELGVDCSERVEALEPTAVCFDLKRWQPVFCFVAMVDMTYEQVVRAAETAPHGFETARFLPRPWTAADARTRDLLTGDSPRDRLASNHAEVALLFALFYRDGPERVVALLDGSC